MPDSDSPQSVDSALTALLAPPVGTPDDRFRKRLLYYKFILPACAAGLFLLLILYAAWWKAPSTFPVGIVVSVRNGMTLNETATLLAELHVIRSPFWFKAWSVLLGGEGGLKAGSYYLSAPASVSQLAGQFTRGAENTVPIRVTIPEGLSNASIAALLSKSLPHFDGRRFEKLAAEREGYLFPDTYLFPPGISEEGIIGEMEENFMKRVLPLREKIQAFGQSLHNVLTMASLIEGEVRTTETRRQVSGILWKRLESGMPLQVDAVFPYILGRNTFEITLEDLKFDSPYNTYLYPGLPPGPINNPGLDAIMAAITPAPSKYLYYLTDTDGRMRYATTYAEHLVNRAKYLGK